jgi:hypothetical protein
MPTPRYDQQSTAELTPEAIPVALSIREVASQTGISEEVLRIWEHRYGWPRPGRRANGYRTYPLEVVPLLQAVRQVLERGRAIGDLLRDPIWSGILESGRLPVTESSERPSCPDWSTIPQPSSEAAQKVRVALEQALQRGDQGAVARIEAGIGRLHPRDREAAVTAILCLWRSRQSS